VSEYRSRDGPADTISRRTPASLDEGSAPVLAVLLADGSRVSLSVVEPHPGAQE